MRMNLRRRSSIATFTGLVLLASLLPLTAAQAAVSIEFLNPSSSMNLSDKEDLDGTYHLVAWVGTVPSSPIVEFEITSPTTLATESADGTRITADTWDADLDLSGLPDGTYDLVARLYDGATQVAETEESVTVRRDDELPPAAPNTVEIRYPENGGSFGMSAPKGKRVNGLIDVTTSDGTQQVRTLYTTSQPGTAPQWVACGSEAVEENLTARVRCTLAEGVGVSQVTAIAAVANDTLVPADPSALADASSDAHRVTPYTQIAREVDINPEQVANAATGACQKFTVTVSDQNSRPMAAANVDVHATGPGDSIRFGLIEDETTGVDETSAWQAPDKSHVASPRPGIHCADKDNAGQQGDHNIPGQNDPQHIESTTGTNDNGQFVFALYSGVTGGTEVVAWADVDDDDALQATETSGGSRVGWGQAPPAPTRDLFLDPTSTAAETGSCQRFELIGRLSGSPDVGQNVDIHISGPDETVAFCLPADASTGTAPNAGTHTGNADDTTTRHLEGNLDSTGRFIFGVTTAGEGTTSIVAWADSLEDDVQGTDEASETASVGWAISGERTISISSSRSRVPKGRRVSFTGRIDGASACEAGQTVKLKAKRLSGGTFNTIKSTTTDEDGDYFFRVLVKKSRKYNAVAPVSGPCEKAKSRTITVRAT